MKTKAEKIVEIIESSAAAILDDKFPVFLGIDETELKSLKIDETELKSLKKGEDSPEIALIVATVWDSDSNIYVYEISAFNLSEAVIKDNSIFVTDMSGEQVKMTLLQERKIEEV